MTAYSWGYGGTEVGWAGFEEVTSLGNGSYDWHEIRVFRRLADGALMWAECGGCSCNSFESDVDSDEFLELRATDQEFRTAVMGMSEWYASGTQKVEFLAGVDRLLRAL